VRNKAQVHVFARKAAASRRLIATAGRMRAMSSFRMRCRMKRTTLPRTECVRSPVRDPFETTESIGGEGRSGAVTCPAAVPQKDIPVLRPTTAAISACG
jgi:hypothetical protein